MKGVNMNCQLCEKAIETNDEGKPIGRFPMVKSWSKSDDGKFTPSFRSLNIHRDCVLDLLESKGVSLRPLV
tara:strand:- start:751 stop:963 length:213 start_codon:yes stop_codon:yes gene_type:complete